MLSTRGSVCFLAAADRDPVLRLLQLWPLLQAAPSFLTRHEQGNCSHPLRARHGWGMSAEVAEHSHEHLYSAPREPRPKPQKYLPRLTTNLPRRCCGRKQPKDAPAWTRGLGSPASGGVSSPIADHLTGLVRLVRHIGALEATAPSQVLDAYPI